MILLHVTTTKSKNAESFYITQTFKKKNGSSSSKHIKKLGTLAELSEKLNTNRNGVMQWAREQAKLETEKYKKENEEKKVLIPFHSDRQLEYNKQKFYVGGYLFLQSIYYELGLDKVCRKIKAKHKYEYDLNAILSDLIFTRILDPNSKRSSFKSAQSFLEAPSYELHDIYRALNVLAEECDFIQSEAYSPQYAAYQKNVREKQIERAQKMIVTDDGEIAEKDIYTIDYEKIKEEEKYDGMYAICTDLLDDDVSDLIHVSEGRWQIENCFRILKTEFSARPVYVRNDDRIKAHFLVCFLALLIFRLLEKKLDKKYTCSEILDTLKEMNFADIEEQGYMPLYSRTKLTDALHEVCNFRTDYQFISKRKMKTIQKESKGR